MSPITATPGFLPPQPDALLQQLIRFDTTNPPGNETACIHYIRDLLASAGVESTILALAPDRPNLMARLKGRGSSAPVLLYGHVDVVTTAGQPWQHPPFSGDIADGFIWGRGALDMKGGVAMMVSAFLRAATSGDELPCDVVLAIVSDEEGGGDFGARYLVEQHAHLFKGIRYAMSEFGGFPMQLGIRNFYPIGVAEKQMCAIRATVHGPGGHGSMPMHGGAMARLAQLLHKLDTTRLPVRITPAAQVMCEAVASGMPSPLDAMVRNVLDPAQTDMILDALGEAGRNFDPLLHNTVNATIVRGGDKINVIPSEITVMLDGRMVPGARPADILAELRQVCGDEVEFVVERFDEGPPAPDMGWFDMLTTILRETDPDTITVPYMLSGVTDARFFTKLGIQTYGFLPIPAPITFEFARTIHAADERIPVNATAYGADCLYKALQRA